MFLKGKKTTLILIALLCLSVTVMSTAATAGSYALSAAAENMVVGAGQCRDFLNGFMVGMGIASFFGCVWCPGVVLASKTVQMLVC